MDNDFNVVQEQANDGLGYKGLVELGIVKNGKKYKKITANSGELELFKYLGRCLSAKVNPNFDISQRPGQIKLYNGETALLSYGINYIDCTMEEGETNEFGPFAKVVYHFLIPGSIVFGREFNTVKLAPLGNSSVVYATATFTNGTDVVITNIDTNVYIDWTLTIRNA